MKSLLPTDTRKFVLGKQQSRTKTIRLLTNTYATKQMALTPSSTSLYVLITQKIKFSPSGRR